MIRFSQAVACRSCGVHLANDSLEDDPEVVVTDRGFLHPSCAEQPASRCADVPRDATPEFARFVGELGECELLHPMGERTAERFYLRSARYLKQVPGLAGRESDVLLVVAQTDPAAKVPAPFQAAEPAGLFAAVVRGEWHEDPRATCALAVAQAGLPEGVQLVHACTRGSRTARGFALGCFFTDEDPERYVLVHERRGRKPTLYKYVPPHKSRGWKEILLPFFEAREPPPPQFFQPADVRAPDLDLPGSP